MLVKSLFILLSIIVLNHSQVSGKNKKNLVFLYGSIKNYTNQLIVEDVSEFQDLTLPSSTRIIVPDSKGQFSIQFNLNQPNYFRIGRNILYLSPGDSISMVIDYDYPENSFFKGTHANENNYLKSTPYPSGGSFLESGDTIRKTLEQTIDAIISKADNRQRALNGYKTISNEFRKLENARLKADILNSLQYSFTYFVYVHKISNQDSLANFRTEFSKVMKPHYIKYSRNFIDINFLKLTVYRNVVSLINSNNDVITPMKLPVADWIKARDIGSSIRKLDDKEKLKTYKIKISEVKNLDYRNAVQNTLDKLLEFGKGDSAADFMAYDAKGNPTSLKSFSGKLIYLDLWATWCGPCMPELEKMELLKAEYSNNPNIVFLTLSIDHDKIAWKNSLARRNATGEQLIIHREKLDAYGITGVPRTVIIGKDFKIIDMHGPMPSDKQIRPYIDKLLQN